MQNNLIERLFWHPSERDALKVAHHLFCHKEMDTVYTPDETTLFDFFFHYLREIEVFPLLEELDPDTQKRENIPFLQFILVYLMKVAGSIPKMEIVFRDWLRHGAFLNIFMLPVIRPFMRRQINLRDVVQYFGSGS